MHRKWDFFFYSFYSKESLIKGTFGFILLHLVMFPLWFMAIYFIIVGPSFSMAIVMAMVTAINWVGYISALVKYIVATHRYNKLKKLNLLPPDNIDPIWLVTDRH